MHIEPADIGFANEAKVSEALTNLQREPERYGLLTTIVKFIRTRRYSPLDRRGVDFLVILEEDLEVTIQVKSSEHGRRKFNKIGKRIGFLIPCIVVSIHDALESVITKLVEVIKLADSAVRRKKNHIAHSQKIKVEKRAREEE